MTGGSEADLVARAAKELRARCGAGRLERATACLVLGSGLWRFTDRLENACSVPFGEIPGWPAPAVEGHGGSLVVGKLSGADVACLSGRVHLYEGHEPAAVVRAVRTLHACGVRAFLLTNAAGGIADRLAPGDLMVIRDHLNLTGRSPLVGAHDARLGPRFPDQSAVYDAKLRALLRLVDPGLQEGVYAGLLGPSYETPAEVAMLGRLGADAVGMSTVLEAIALNALGASVAGVSLISNLAAGIADTPLCHDEVIEAGRRAETRLCALLTGFCEHLPRR
ncbi:MAG: purine-nucleoside phosphorylase [Planctomycetota bacterium]